MQNLGKLNDYLEKIDKVISEGKYKDDWKSLAKHDVPTWYRDGKLGIFVHWGVYTVPEFSDEWYPRRMYLKDQPRRGLDCFQHHIDTYGEHKDFGYKDLIPMFKAEKFDASEWVSLFKEAGAKFVMPVAEHHDGFQMYDSELSDWNAVKMGPKRDLIAEWKEEILKQDLVFTASSHRIEHYFFFEGGREFDSDLKDLSYGDLYWPAATKEEWNTKDGVVVDELFMKDWLARTCEIVDKYQPQIIFFDWWIQVEPLKPYLKKFMAYYYNRALEWGKEVTVNYKHDAFIHTSAVKDIERGQLTDVSPFFWQNDTSVAKHSWSYTHGNEYKHPNDIISDLVDV
ncbi:MAG: alpha-L-fucosidase, partial [Clostridia bacterium]